MGGKALSPVKALFPSVGECFIEAGREGDRIGILQSMNWER